MEPPEWIFPCDLNAALDALSVSDAMAVAGGTTVIDLMKMGHAHPRHLVDISRLPFSEITLSERTLEIGATATNSAVARHEAVCSEFPALSQAILLGASPQIRNAATVGGNLMQASRCLYFRSPDWPCNRRVPESGCEALRVPLAVHAILGTSRSCIATHPSDMAVALLALDATVRAQGRDGRTGISMADFYLLPMDTPHRQTALPEGAIITAVEVPRTVAAKNSGYLKLRGRASYEFAACSVAMAFASEDDVVTQFSVALGGVGSRPWRNVEAERCVVGRKLSKAAIDAFCDHLLAEAQTCPETEHKLGLVRGGVHHLTGRLAGQ